MQLTSEEGIEIDVRPIDLDRSIGAKLWLTSIKTARFSPREMDLATAILTEIRISTPEDTWERQCLVVSRDLLDFSEWLKRIAEGESPEAIQIETSTTFSVLPQREGLIGIRIEIKGVPDEAVNSNFLVEESWLEGFFDQKSLKGASESLQKEVEQFPNYLGI